MELFNLGDYIKELAVQKPEESAIIYPVRVSYTDMNTRIDRLCHGLSQVGIKKGSKIIVLTTTDSNFYTLVSSLLRIGAIPVLIDPGVGTRVMKKSLAGVNADGFIGMPKAHLLRILFHKSFSAIPIIITVGRRWFWGGHRLEQLFLDLKTPYAAPKAEPDDIGGIFFTSGSTGPPKGVIYRNRMFVAQIKYFSEHFKWSPKEVDLCTFPLIGLFSLCLGVPIVIADLNPTQPDQLNPARIWKNLHDNRCTHMFASPMILRKLVDYAESIQTNLPDIKRVVTAGAPVPVELLVRLKKILSDKAEIHTPYGATEALPISDATASLIIEQQEAFPEKSGICVGKVMKGTQIAIIPILDETWPADKALEMLPANHIGEIVVSGPVVTDQYLHNDHANSLGKITDEKQQVWHRMGDVGCFDELGILWFFGRKNHRVETASGCLFSIPTEQLFNRHHAVRRSALVGIPHPVDGKLVPVICIEAISTVRKKDHETIRDELQKIADFELPDYSISHYLFHPSFPVDPRHNAKIFREKLSEWATKKIK